MVRAEDLGLTPASLARIKALKSEIDYVIRQLLDEGAHDGSINTHDPKMTPFALAGALNWIAHWYRENQSMTEIETGRVRRIPSSCAHRIRHAARALKLHDAGSRDQKARGADIDHPRYSRRF